MREDQLFIFFSCCLPAVSFSQSLTLILSHFSFQNVFKGISNIKHLNIIEHFLKFVQITLNCPFFPPFSLLPFFFSPLLTDNSLFPPCHLLIFSVLLSLSYFPFIFLFLYPLNYLRSSFYLLFIASKICSTLHPVLLVVSTQIT